MTALALYLTLLVTVAFQEEAAPIAGALAAHHAHLDPVWVALACALGTWGGDLALYVIGRRGHRFLDRPGFAKALGLVRRHPRGAPLAVRFAYGLRFTLPIACGVAHLPAARYALWAGVSAALWSALFTVVGWTAGELALRLFRDVRHYELPLIAAVLTTWVLLLVWRFARRREEGSDGPRPGDAAAGA
jgi:membrane protein DedA with SNARE-associated domain